MEHIPAIQKAGLHEANRIAQMVMQREAHMAVLASAGERADRVKAAKVPPPDRMERVEERSEEDRRHDRDPDGRAYDGSHHDGDAPARRRIDLTA